VVFSSTPVSSTNKTDRHDITEILLKVALNTIILTFYEQITQWPEKKEQKNNDQQNNTHKTKDRVTRTPLKTGSELMCSGMVGSSCSTNEG
jgi:hypothetical protein